MDQNAVWAALSAGVPEDVERLYQAGRFAAADRRIRTLLGQEHLPAIARDALRARAEQMRRLPESYPHTRAAALAMLRRELPDFSDAEFDALVAADRIDWRWIEGEPYYQERFLETLRIYPDMNARGLRPDPVSDFRDQVLSRLQSHSPPQSAEHALKRLHHIDLGQQIGDFFISEYFNCHCRFSLDVALCKGILLI